MRSIFGASCGQSARANWDSNRDCGLAVSAHNRRVIGKEFDTIVKEDIDALVKNAVCEKRDTEYKQQPHRALLVG